MSLTRRPADDSGLAIVGDSWLLEVPRTPVGERWRLEDAGTHDNSAAKRIDHTLRVLGWNTASASAVCATCCRASCIGAQCPEKHLATSCPTGGGRRRGERCAAPGYYAPPGYLELLSAKARQRDRRRRDALAMVFASKPMSPRFARGAAESAPLAHRMLLLDTFHPTEPRSLRDL